jgi:hypothetical protein
MLAIGPSQGGAHPDVRGRNTYRSWMLPLTTQDCKSFEDFT